MASWYIAGVFAICLSASAQSKLTQNPGPIQKPGEFQKIKGTWQTPARFQTAGEIQKIKDDCRTRLLLSADTLFGFDKTAISADAEGELYRLGAALQKESKFPIAIEGHTDSVGSDAYNRDLSQKRAKAVETWLVSHGYLRLAAARVKGYGKAKPLAPNANPDGSDNPEGRRKNRRVEAVVDRCKD